MLNLADKFSFDADFLYFKRTAYSVSGVAYRAIQMGPVPAEYDKMYIKLVDDELIMLNQVEFSDGNYGEAFKGIIDFDRTIFLESELKAMADVAHKFAGIQTNEVIEISYLKYAFELNEIA